jgi:putative transposase
MPNHVHGIIILQEDAASAYENQSAIYAMLSPTVGAHHDAPLRVQPGSLGSIIRQYKSSVTRKIVQQYGVVPNIWQRNYYEHIIRNDEEHKRIHLYIESNPIHWISDDENPEMTS